jgi:sterol desaturase/sphingolipid hydroxylase (fatty acid hydroxylase superfamily)
MEWSSHPEFPDLALIGESGIFGPFQRTETTKKAYILVIKMELVTLLKTIQPYAVVVVFVTIYLAEHIIPQRRELIDHKHDLINLMIGAANLLLVAVCAYGLQWLLTFGERHHIGLLFMLPFWLKIIVGLLLTDLFMYWWHRANHGIPFFWSFHKFHHEDTKLNISSSIRFHTAELLFTYVFKLPLFLLMGINVTTVILYGLILLPVVTLNHSNVRIGKATDKILRLFISSPYMHRVHHSVIIQETDSNYGAVLPYWDRIFQSYNRPSDRPIKFGL